MTRDDVLRMAREAGFLSFASGRFSEQEAIERFAALVAEKEREECAKLSLRTGDWVTQLYGDGAECIATSEEIAEAIRARSQPTPTDSASTAS